MDLGAPSRRHRAFPRDASSARAARDFVAAELASMGAPPELIDDFRLAVSELAANAIEYGSDTHIEVSISADEYCWELEVAGAVASRRRPPGADTWDVAGPDERSGRGLGIVRKLMDVTSVVEVDGRIAVRCGRRR
jgi:anti-sigma regulatory factor (Ser/Thr protein kinase)